MLGDEITLTLNSPLTDEQFDALTDVDMENTPHIVFHTKSGKEVEYLKVVRCKDCMHWYNDADTGMACEFTNLGQPMDGFCNWGEMKGE